MNSIKVSELFYSIQGEGRYMGVPSVFLRTFGCNFTCDGFNMPRGEKTNERHSINPKLYKSYKDLPLVVGILSLSILVPFLKSTVSHKQ
jgi:organic radical activating enzyme